MSEDALSTRPDKRAQAQASSPLLFCSLGLDSSCQSLLLLYSGAWLFGHKKISFIAKCIDRWIGG